MLHTISSFKLQPSCSLLGLGHWILVTTLSPWHSLRLTVRGPPWRFWFSLKILAVRFGNKTRLYTSKDWGRKAAVSHCLSHAFYEFFSQQPHNAEQLTIRKLWRYVGNYWIIATRLVLNRVRIAQFIEQPNLSSMFYCKYEAPYYCSLPERSTGWNTAVFNVSQ